MPLRNHYECSLRLVHLRSDSVLSNVVHLAVLDKSSYTYTSVTDLHAQMVFAYVV